MDGELITKEKEVIKIKNIDLVPDGMGYRLTGESVNELGKIVSLRFTAEQVNTEYIGPEDNPTSVIRITIFQE